MKKPTRYLTLLALLLPLSACSGPKEKQDVTIVYTNDIHGYIDNVTKDSSGQEVDALRLSKLSGYVKQLRKKERNVILVDAGDQVQGTVYGSMDKGVEIIPIMNKVGYQLATVGNHDFDFGMNGFRYFRDHADFPYVSCNFLTLPERQRVLEPYKIFEFEGAKVGFIGVSTPETITSSTPAYFQNDKGEFIYTFLGQESPNDLYQAVQNSIDELQGKVDYLIALGHVGVSVGAKKRGYSSLDVIANTKGLTAWIDGHSHTVIEQQMVKTKDGKDCLLTQTGCYLSSFGQLHLGKDGSVSSRLISDSESVDAEVKTMEEALINRVQTAMGQPIATAANPLYVDNPDKPSQRLIRARETNLADLCSDSLYWYINEKKQLNCDIGVENGGGIRAAIESGEVTYLEVEQVHPFGNQVCLIKTKGINILNAIEMGVDVSGQWDPDWDCPAENGGFLHLSGLTYDVDTTIPSSVKKDENGMFVSVDGAYRVKNVQIYDRKSQTYVPFDTEKEYTIGGSNYLLKQSGNGLSMFVDAECIVDYIDADYVVLAEFMKAFDQTLINNANSPLKGYANYRYDYEDPSGSGRINFLGLSE